MARPERNNVDYFPFLCEEGKKMYYLEETYGNDGFAVFVKLLRELAKTNFHFLDLSKNTTVMFLSAKCKVSQEILLSIIKDLVELEKFDTILWNENKIIWCQDFIDSIQDAYIKRKNNCITYDGLFHLLISLGIRKPNKRKSKDDGNTQSIVEDTKVEKTKIPPFEDFSSYAVGKKSNVSMEHLKLKYDSWVENGWKDGLNKPIKNWKTKILNTIPHLKEGKTDTGRYIKNDITNFKY